MQGKHNLLATKQILRVKSIIILGLLVLITTFGQLSVFAHGGEDHGEEQVSTPIANVGEVNTKLAKASTVEALIKYPTPKLGEQTIIRIFLTDLITNAPIDKTKVTLKLQYLGQKLALVPNITPIVQADSSEIVVNANETNTAGIYEAKVTFSNIGQYSMLASFNSSTLDAQAFISGIVVPQITTLNNISNNTSNNAITIIVVIITLVSMIMLILLYLFSLAADRSKQTKAQKDVL